MPNIRVNKQILIRAADKGLLYFADNFTSLKPEWIGATVKINRFLAI